MLECDHMPCGVESVVAMPKPLHVFSVHPCCRGAACWLQAKKVSYISRPLSAHAQRLPTITTWTSTQQQRRNIKKQNTHIINRFTLILALDVVLSFGEYLSCVCVNLNTICIVDSHPKCVHVYVCSECVHDNRKPAIRHHKKTEIKIINTHRTAHKHQFFCWAKFAGSIQCILCWTCIMHTRYG